MFERLWRGWWMVLLALGGLGSAQAQPGGDWSVAFPEDPRAAIAVVHGSDDTDTKARQSAAVHELGRLVLRITNNEFSASPLLTAREKKLHRDYQAFYESFGRTTVNALNAGLSGEQLERLGNRRPSAAFADLEFRYRSSPVFQREVFTAVLGAEWVARHYEPLLAREAEAVGGVRRQDAAVLEQNNEMRDAVASMRAVRLAWRGLGGAVFVAGAAWTVLAWRKVRVRGESPMRLTGRRAGWVLDPVTGTASGVKVYSTQQKHTSVQRFEDGRPDQVSTSVTTTRHCEFMLSDGGGVRPVRVSGPAFQVGEGHRVSCVWPRKGDGSMDMLLSFNHTTGYRVVFPAVVSRLVGPRLLPGVVMAAGVALALHPATAVLFLLVFFGVWCVMMWVRTRAFRRAEVDRVLGVLRAGEGVSPPGG